MAQGFLQFSAEQKTFDIGGVKVGGQPGAERRGPDVPPGRGRRGSGGPAGLRVTGSPAPLPLPEEQSADDDGHHDEKRNGHAHIHLLPPR